jgi:hypothetical protein
MRFALLILPLVSLAACSGADGKDDTATDDTGDTGGGGSDCVEENGACVLEGTINENLTLTADKAWLLRGGVWFGDGATNVTLTVEPGTKIYGESATDGFLVINRGAKIEAVGTASAPIVFTTDQAVGSRARGQWGGLVLNGKAPINACADGSSPCEAEGEGGTGTYGGDDPADDSGTLKYVRIEFGGTEISPDNEINGLSLQGVGSGTEIDHIQIHRNLDDGVEFFGGTVNVKHLVVTEVGDDSIDWTLGYSGRIQHALVVQASDAGNYGFELDNNEDDYSATPQTGGIVSNVTLVGSMSIDEDNLALLARRGTAGKFWNLAATGFTAGCLGIRDEETYAHFTDGTAEIAHSAFACTPNFEVEEEGEEDVGGTEEAVFASGTGNVEVSDLMLEADYQPSAGSPLLGAGATPADSFFDAVDYIGAFDGTNDWTAGWIDTSDN